MTTPFAAVIELDGERFPLLAQLGRAQDVGLPEAVLAGPGKQALDVFRLSAILLAHQAEGVSPAGEVAFLAATRERIDNARHPLGKLMVDRLTPYRDAWRSKCLHRRSYYR